MLRRVLTEPLLHFFVLGSLLFVVFSLVSDDETPRQDEIAVTAGKIEQLAALFTRTWQRPPTQTELEGLVDDWVREEAAYREAVGLGLDRNDAVLRRRLRQKLEFMAGDVAAMALPSEDDLRAYLEANADAFRVDPRLSFRQVYLGPERGEALADEARDLRTLLRGDPYVDASALGEATLLDHAYADVSEREIAGLFGRRFATTLTDLPPGEWEGPIESGYGAHLVIVDAREAGRLPSLAEVRDRVRGEWEGERREEALEALYDELVGRYRVSVEWPGPGASEERS
jgi:hypothetical protein